jgi:hypothetical protein
MTPLPPPNPTITPFALPDNDLSAFWQASLAGALLVGVWVAWQWPTELTGYASGVLLGGLYWSTVARRTHWLTGQKALPAWKKWLTITFGMVIMVALSMGVAQLALKHPIVFVGLFIYKLGIVACFVRSLLSQHSVSH